MRRGTSAQLFRSAAVEICTFNNFFGVHQWFPKRATIHETRKYTILFAQLSILDFGNFHEWESSLWMAWALLMSLDYLYNSQRICICTITGTTSPQRLRSCWEYFFLHNLVRQPALILPDHFLKLLPEMCSNDLAAFWEYWRKKQRL